MSNVKPIHSSYRIPVLSINANFGRATYYSFNFTGYRASVGIKYYLSRRFSIGSAISYFNAKPTVQPDQGSDFVRQTDVTLLANFDVIQWRRHTLSIQAGGGISESKAQKYFNVFISLVYRYNNKTNNKQ